MNYIVFPDFMVIIIWHFAIYLYTLPLSAALYFQLYMFPLSFGMLGARTYIVHPVSYTFALVLWQSVCWILFGFFW